jgi:hypothetical protein
MVGLSAPRPRPNLDIAHRASRQRRQIRDAQSARVPVAQVRAPGSGGMKSVEVCAPSDCRVGIAVTPLLLWSPAVKDS